MTRLYTTSGAFAALLLATGCIGYVPDAYPPPPHPIALQPTDLGDNYRVMPKPNPHRLASRTGPETSSETKKHASSGPSEKTADSKPLTPAELRAAVPLQKLSNPQQTLSDAQIKSVWGDVVGKVRSVDVSGGTLKAVDANVAGAKKVVRMDPAHLKYVKSRNVVVTTMSKPDVEKLPSASQL
ncbi:MAG TPA: hypothetical protein VLC74_02260 [Rhizomicrobium sp.]|nr:hypothetical protein [Rhizomicrobium sp.]